MYIIIYIEYINAIQQYRRFQIQGEASEVKLYPYPYFHLTYFKLCTRRQAPTQARTHAGRQARRHARTHAITHAHTHAHTHAYTHAHTHAYTHARTLAFLGVKLL